MNLITRSLLLVYSLLLGCKEQQSCKDNIQVNYSSIDKVLSVRKDKLILKEYSSEGIRVPDGFRPVHTSISDCTLYINVFNRSIEKIDISRGISSPYFRLDTGKFKYDDKYELKAESNGLWIKSNRNLVLLALENAQLKASYIDSLFKHHPELISKVSGYWDYSIVGEKLYLNIQYKEDGDSLIKRVYTFNIPNSL